MEGIFSRHLSLVGEDGIKKLLSSAVLVAGAGGLGCTVLQLLVRTGVGKIYIVDYGFVDEPDLNRQILYSKEHLGREKVFAAEEVLKKIRDVEVVPMPVAIDEGFNIPEDVDLVVDCLDNFKGKFILSDLCFKYNKPLIHAGIEGYYGQVTTIIPGRTPSLRGIFNNMVVEERRCLLSVIGMTPVILGALQANEAIKYLTGTGELLYNKILVVNLLDCSFDVIYISER